MGHLQICIGPTIRIGRESWCLPYAGFLFFLLLKILTEKPIFLLTVIIYHFIRKLLSKLILDHGKCPNQKACTFTFMRFLVGALPEVQNQFWKQFSNKVLYNYCLNFFCGAFRSVFEEVQKWISHCNLKM